MDAAAGLFAVALVGLVLSRRAPGAAMTTDPRPRGIRNNNPGNIEYSAANDWQGQTGSDGRYAIFSAPVWGIRAMARVLDSYRARGVDTLATIVATWAPAHENPTAAYVGAIENITGIDLEAVIVRDHYPDVIAAMIYFENGEQPYSQDTNAEGINRA